MHKSLSFSLRPVSHVRSAWAFSKVTNSEVAWNIISIRENCLRLYFKFISHNSAFILQFWVFILTFFHNSELWNINSELQDINAEFIEKTDFLSILSWSHSAFKKCIQSKLYLNIQLKLIYDSQLCMQLMLRTHLIYMAIPIEPEGRDAIAMETDHVMLWLTTSFFGVSDNHHQDTVWQKNLRVSVHY